MKRFLLAICILLLVMVGCWAQGPSTAIIKQAHAVTYNITQKAILGSGSKCSATAIGPHALLTASHCEAPTDLLQISGVPAHIIQRVRDEFDHTILLVDYTFPRFATVSLSDPLERGESVFVFGNPGRFTDIFRHGCVAGFESDDDPTAQVLFDLNGFHGDSGSAVFDEHGSVVDVISTITGDTHNHEVEWDSFKLMGGFRLAFKREDLDRAAAFVPPSTTRFPSPETIFPLIKFERRLP